MKKLLFFVFATLFSINAMAMGFPQNTFEQQSRLTKNTKKSEIVTQIQSLEKSITATVESVTVVEDASTKESFVEMITDYVIEFFKDRIFDRRAIAVKSSKILKAENVALKKEFEFCILS